MLVIYCDQGNFTLDINSKPNDIFESGNTIVTVGMNLIEVFEFSNNKLFKKSLITLNDNLNNIISINNDDNSNSDNEILCIEFAADSFLVCGHGSGLISVWIPLGEHPFMKQLRAKKMHKGRINKILYTKLQNGNYLFTCSSDKTIKKYCMDQDNCEKEKPFENEVMNIKRVEESYYQENNMYFIVSLRNGNLFVLNTEIEVIFEIPSRFNTHLVRQVLSMENLEKNDKKGSYLLITENKEIEIYCWIKEGSFESHLSKRNENFHQNHNPKHGHYSPFRVGFGKGGYH